uniref:Putative penelope-2 aae n=1 Tax=Xenopsylla cheopis TaxID=163159 RepID=A0A6M2DT15_XENCH
MCSFGITTFSIFCLNSIEFFKKYDIKHHTTMSLHWFRQSVLFILEKSYFTFEKKYYMQIKGSPMGSSVSASLAELTMQFLEQKVLDSLTTKPVFYYRYVDDIILCHPNHEIENLLKHFNSFNNSLQFTHETESEQRISFLDTQLIRKNNRIITNWYRKPTWSGRYTNFFSYVPIAIKINTVNNLIDKAITLSHKDFWEDNLKIIKTTFIKNSYPKELLTRLINTRTNHLTKGKLKLSTNMTTHTTENNTTASFIKLPYIHTNCNFFKKLLKKHNIRTVFVSENNLKKQIFTKLKTSITKDLQTNIIYKIDCQDCGDCYVGETSQYLHKRIYQHTQDQNNSNNKTKESKKNLTELTRHTQTNNHKFDFENTQILYKETNQIKRRIIESYYIHTVKNSVNNRTNTTMDNSTKVILEQMNSICKTIDR